MAIRIIAISCVIFCLLGYAISDDSDLDEQWEQYKVQFSKKYTDLADENLHKDSFATKLIEIEDHNEKFEAGEVSFMKRINKFTDQLLVKTAAQQ